MRHILLPGAPATRPFRVGQPTAAARLVAPPGRTLGVISRLLCTAIGAVDLASVAAAADQRLPTAPRAQIEPPRRLSGNLTTSAATWTNMSFGAIIPRQSCLAHCGGAAPSSTGRLLSAPRLFPRTPPIVALVAKACQRPRRVPRRPKLLLIFPKRSRGWGFPGGSTGTSRPLRFAARRGAPLRGRVPPVDYRENPPLPSPLPFRHLCADSGSHRHQ